MSVNHLCPLFCTALLSLVLIQGCDVDTPQEPSAPATLAKFGWLIENVDSSFWTSSTQSGHLFYSFFIKYDGSMSANDISTARVYLPSGNTWWSLNTQYYLDTDNKVLGGYGRWFLSDDPDALPLGMLKAEVVFTNGTTSTVSLDVPECGSTGNSSGYSFIKTEDDTTYFAAGTSTTVIPRPTNTSATKSNTAVTVNFTLNDSRINNGWVWLYNSSHEYIGGFFYFRNNSTGAVSGYLNNGTGLATTSANTIVIPSSECLTSSGTAIALSDIAECIVVVTDGSQYSILGSGHYLDHDCRAYSARTTVN